MKRILGFKYLHLALSSLPICHKVSSSSTACPEYNVICFNWADRHMLNTLQQWIKHMKLTNAALTVYSKSGSSLVTFPALFLIIYYYDFFCLLVLYHFFLFWLAIYWSLDCTYNFSRMLMFILSHNILTGKSLCSVLISRVILCKLSLYVNDAIFIIKWLSVLRHAVSIISIKSLHCLS